MGHLLVSVSKKEMGLKEKKIFEEEEEAAENIFEEEEKKQVFVLVGDSKEKKESGCEWLLSPWSRFISD